MSLQSVIPRRQRERRIDGLPRDRIRAGRPRLRPSDSGDSGDEGEAGEKVERAHGPQTDEAFRSEQGVGLSYRPAPRYRPTSLFVIVQPDYRVRPSRTCPRRVARSERAQRKHGRPCDFCNFSRAAAQASSRARLGSLEISAATPKSPHLRPASSALRRQAPPSVLGVYFSELPPLSAPRACRANPRICRAGALPPR